MSLEDGLFPPQLLPETPREFPPEAAFRLRPSLVLRRESFGGLLFFRESWQLFELNPTAFDILSHLAQEPLGIAPLQAALRQQYPALSGSAENKISSFVLRMASAGFLEQAPASDRAASPRTMPPGHGIFPQTVDLHDEDNSHASASYLSAPLFAWWDITAKCNLKCKQCYSASGHALPDELSTSQAIGILDQLAARKVFYIYFLGGEPFLRDEFFSILEHCKSLGLGVMISTNGWFVDRDCADRLASLVVRHVRVSIDGANAKTHDAIRGVQGSFERAVNAVRCLKAAGVPMVGMAPTLMQRNVHEAPEIIDLARNLGATEIQLGQVCKVGRGEQLDELTVEQIADLRQMLARKNREWGSEIRISGSEGIWEGKPFRSRVLDGNTFPSIMGCGAGRTCMAIAPNGAVRACLLNRRPFGDLSKTSFDDLWRSHPSPELMAFRQVKESCNECNYATVCSGPCPMERGTLPAEREFFIQRQKEEERGGGKEHDSASSSIC